MSLHAEKNWREKAHDRPTKETTCHHDANLHKRTQTTTTVRSTMVSAVAIAAARRREQEAVERQEAALGIRLEQPQNPPGNIIAGNIIAGAVAAIDDQDIFDSPNAAAAAAIEGDSTLAAANLIERLSFRLLRESLRRKELSHDCTASRPPLLLSLWLRNQERVR